MSEWKEYKLGEVLTFQRGYDLPKGNMVDGPYPVAGSNGIIGYHTKYTTKGPGITIGRSGNIGMSHYYPIDFWAHNTTLYVKDFKGNEPKFIYYLLKTIDFSLFNTGSAVPSLNRNHVHELVVSIPPLDEQKRIAGVLSSLDDKIDLLHRENATLEALAETLFRHYFIENPDPTWKEGKLGDVVDVKSGFAFKGSSFVEGGKYKLVTIKAVQDGFLSLENSDCITEVPSNVKDYCYLKKGDILLSLTGNVGRCCLVDSDGLLLNQRVALLVAKDKRNWPFVYIFFRLQTTKSLLEEMAKGTAQPNLSPVELAKMSFLIPPQIILEQFGIEASPIIGKVLSNRQQMQILSTLRDTLLPRLMAGEVKEGGQ